MKPRFSILVPTRQRPDTLASTLTTLVEQPGDDFEIVVADNFGDAEVTKVIGEARKIKSQVKHIRSDRVLPMAENWERGLAACTGQFITVLGDDDGFLPSTLTLVRELIRSSGAKVVSWSCHTYWWPDTIAYWHANRLYVINTSTNTIEWRDSRAVLSAFFRDQIPFGDLPMIYNAFVGRELVKKVHDKYGRYFMPPEMPPDVVSGIINLMYSERYLHSNRPLAVRGNSKRSNGTAHWTRAFGKEQRKTYLDDEGKELGQLFHPDLVPSPNLGFGIANIKLLLKDMFFRDENDFRIDLSLLVKSTISELNLEPESYDDNLADALRLADKIGFKVDPKLIPPKQPAPTRQRIQGPFGTIHDLIIAVNCDQVKIFDIAAAASLAEAISPLANLSVARFFTPNPTPSMNEKKTDLIEEAPRRNEPCPCGSGKKYKHCHGSL
jgi:glycosyltransferase involved in cell wall biosynthesis